MRYPLFRLFSVAAVALIAAASNQACGAGNSASGPNDDSGSSSGGSGGSGEGTGGLSLGSGGGGGGGLVEECLAEEAEAEQRELDMVILLDRSGSMGFSGGAGWNGATSALTSFFNAPASAGVTVGMNFFPPTGAGDECVGSTYNPLLVPMGLLPGNATALDTAINTTAPQGGTPTYAAMLGSLTFATDWQENNPDKAVVVVLASDGDPSGCTGNTIPAIAGLAQSALNFNGVLTFTIAIQGVGTLSALDTIAAAGGTGQAFDVTANINLFQQKLEEIRATALGCEYLIPDQVPGGQEFDETKLNVEYTPGGGSPVSLPQRTDLSDCGNQTGWYYDNANNPTKVFLCPASCSVVETDTDAKVTLLFGCPTKLD